MKTYEEMSHDALMRIGEYEKQRKRQKRKTLQTLIPIICFCIIFAVIIALRQAGAPVGKADEKTAGVETKSKNETAPGTDTAVYDETDITAVDITPDIPDTEATPSMQAEVMSDGNGFCYLWWNRLSVGGPLYFGMENDPDGLFDILATYSPSPDAFSTFTYKDKTLEMWGIDAYAEDATDEAKYAYKAAYNAYLETVIPKTVNDLMSKGIDCERSKDRNDAVILCLTPDELKNIPLDVSEWNFDLIPVPVPAVTP